MPGLSAKVFRTYNASITLQNELQQTADHDLSNIEVAKRFYEHCNRQVAILCNHQRTVPRQHDVSMGKLQRQLEWLAEDIAELRAWLLWNSRDTDKPFKWSGASARTPEEPPRVSQIKPNTKEDQANRKLTQFE